MKKVAEMARFSAEDFSRTVSQLDSWDVGITTYRLGATWVCRIDNVSPGATIARATASSRDEALSAAASKARAALATTRVREV